jgi:hypothetical protein
MSSGKKGIVSYLWEVCLGETLPVWATIVGIIIGSLLTAFSSFWIIPKLNESLEKQKIRTEFIIRNLEDINSRTRGLVIDVAEIHSGTLKTNLVDGVLVQRAQSKIAEMQWKAIELAVIFEGKNGGAIIRDYQKSLDGVRVALNNLKSKSDLDASQAAIEKFSESTLMVIRQLAGLGGLGMNEVETPKT